MKIKLPLFAKFSSDTLLKQLCNSFNAYGLTVFLLLLLSPALVHAHNPGQSYMFLSIFEDSIEGRVEIPLTDLNNSLKLNFKTDLSATDEDVTQRIEQIKTYVLKKIGISPGGINTPLKFTGHRLFSVSFAQYAVLEFSLVNPNRMPEFVDVYFALMFDLNPEHRCLLVIENNWKSSTFNNEAKVSLIFDPTKQIQRLDLSSSSTWSGFVGMVELGIHHIAIGIDHILFVIALLLPSVLQRTNRIWSPVPTFRSALVQVIKIITVFTIAHTITLSLATLGTLHMSSRLVESVIAMSIILVALNIRIPLFRGSIWWVVFGFGLFHGFGFADVLASMRIHPNYLVLSLLGFNLGVEAGQLAVVCCVFPVLYFLRNYLFYIRFLLPIGVFLLILISGYWFIERAFLIDLPAGEILNNLLAYVKNKIYEF